MFNKSLKIFLYLLAIFIFQEMVFRIAFPLPEINNLDRINYINWHPDNNKTNYLRDQNWYWQSEPDTQAIFKHYMNRYGFRDDEWLVKKKEGKLRVIFIGDSFVEGLMANQDETITAGFKNADIEQDYEVFNAGMLGMGLNSYLQLLADLIPVYMPDAVFFCIYANDLGQIEPAIPELYLEPELYLWYKPRLLELITQLMSNGPVLSRWNNSFEPFFPGIPSISNPWMEKEEELKVHVNPVLAEAMMNGKLNPYRVNGLCKEERNFNRIPRMGETIPFIKYFCNKFDVEPVVVYIPSRSQVTKHYYQFDKEMCMVDYYDSIDLTTPGYQLYQHFVAQQCQTYNVQLIDLSEVVKEKEDNGEHLYWNYDEHMRADGYLFLGETIWNQWQENRK